ncbi:hypothetical protein WEI85_07840 [Actinomycetes bacterium KLBMP 9797]
MSKNGEAKRLASDLDIPYVEALRVVREDFEDAEQLADEMGLPSAEARRQVMVDHQPAKRLADELGISFGDALRRVRDARALQYRMREIAESIPSMDALLRRAIDGACAQMATEPVARDDDVEDFRTDGLDFDQVDLPHHVVDDIGIDAIAPNLDTMVWNSAETYEDGTEVGTLEVQATVSFDGYIHKSDVYLHDDIPVLDFDWNDHMARVGFDRDVVLEWQGTVRPDAEEVELELEAISELEPAPNPHSVGS